MQFGTDHLGHFALTNLLLPHITDRVVTVASVAHRYPLELQRRLTESGSPVRSLAAHPGWAATNLQSHAASPVMKALTQVGNKFYTQDDKAGALPTLYAATQDLPPANYVGPDGRDERKGGPAPDVTQAPLGTLGR